MEKWSCLPGVRTMPGFLAAQTGVCVGGLGTSGPMPQATRPRGRSSLVGDFTFLLGDVEELVRHPSRDTGWGEVQRSGAWSGWKQQSGHRDGVGRQQRSRGGGVRPGWLLQQRAKPSGGRSSRELADTQHMTGLARPVPWPSPLSFTAHPQPAPQP